MIWPTNQWARELFRSQCAKVTSHRAALRRSEGRESTEPAGGRPARRPGCRLSFQFPVWRVIRELQPRELSGDSGPRGDPANGSETEQDHENTADGKRQRGIQEEGECKARHTSLALSQRWGEGAVRPSHWPLRDWWCHQTVPICDGDCARIEGEQLERGLSQWPL